MAWVLYSATMLYAAFWFCIDPWAVDLLWYLRHLSRLSAWREPGFLRGTMHWNVYGSRLAKLAALLSLHLTALVWVWMTTIWPVAAIVSFVSLGAAAALPWLHERTAPLRIGSERKHFRAVLEAARSLPKLQMLTLEIEGREFAYQHDDDAPETFKLHQADDSNDHGQLGPIGFFLPHNRIAMMINGEEGFVELLEPGERPSSFEFRLFDVVHRYKLRWSVEYEPGLFYSSYAWPLDDLAG